MPPTTAVLPCSTQVALPISVADDRKSTRLNCSHLRISYAVFCLKKKEPQSQEHRDSPRLPRTPPSSLRPATCRPVSGRSQSCTEDNFLTTGSCASLFFFK